MKLAFLALPLLPISGALAQTASPPPPPSASDTHQSAPAPSDLDALLHHQPTRAEVSAREREREGSAAVQKREQREQQEIDQLNQLLLGEPEPKSRE